MRTKHAVSGGRAAILSAALAVAAGGAAFALAAGGAPAAAAQASAPAEPAVAQAHGGPLHGIAHIVIYSINSDGAYFRAVLSGSIGDYGPAVAIYPDDQVDPEHNSELELQLSSGTFRLNIAELDKEFTEHLAHYPDYPATCSEFVSFTTRVPVVADSGTGAYQGITGDFAISATANEAINGADSCTEPPWSRRWEILIFAGPGTVSS